jgi:predicted Zn-dependent protease with MMP-like domain
MNMTARRQLQRVRRYRFERLVRQALDDLPDDIQKMLENVAVVVLDEPDSYQREDLRLRSGETLFGLYQGIPRTQRDSGYNLVAPDRISIFQGPIERACATPEAMQEQVRITVLHEFAHHLGFNEERIAELGLA